MSQSPDSIARVLVVEDNPADVELLRWALDGAGVCCDITVLEDGGEALAFIQENGKYANRRLPDLAILDLNLPKYDGLELVEAMRSNPAFSSVPVAILSSSSSPSDLSKMEEYNVDRYFTKPPNLDDYLQIGFVVKELLESSR
jgi:CheY-like chemotaxis protein